MSDTRARVLVVEDQDSTREALSWNLEHAGYEPVAAEDGQTGWEILETEPEHFDAILLDRMMPRMDGLEVLRRIKVHPVLKLIPVIMQTAKGARKDIQEGLDAGAYYYLIKPFERKTLLAIVNTAVSDRRSYRSLCEKTRKTMGSFRLMQNATYCFRTVEEGQILATLLARCSSEPDDIVLGLSELLTNAVEHGNLGVTYQQKSKLLESSSWDEEIDRRLQLPENSDKRVVVEMERRGNDLLFRIEDQGKGFDWKKYLEMSPERATHTHGRGIAMSRKLCFDSLEFIGKGNEVRVSKKSPILPDRANLRI